MKHNKMMKHILPVLLAAMVAFSSLGLGSLASPVQAEETSVTIMPRQPVTGQTIPIPAGMIVIPTRQITPFILPNSWQVWQSW